mmetsp:Transcript_3591/g.5309  ORF Transcript_3591/g.5309 Transcript_3591/m.5309 type:complete len:241 (-) Transcript_3591:88-810(-)
MSRTEPSEAPTEATDDEESSFSATCSAPTLSLPLALPRSFLGRLPLSGEGFSAELEDGSNDVDVDVDVEEAGTISARKLSASVCSTWAAISCTFPRQVQRLWWTASSCSTWSTTDPTRALELARVVSSPGPTPESITKACFKIPISRLLTAELQSKCSCVQFFLSFVFIFTCSTNAKSMSFSKSFHSDGESGKQLFRFLDTAEGVFLLPLELLLFLPVDFGMTKTQIMLEIDIILPPKIM